MIPPLRELTVRVPIDKFRHAIDGATGPAQKTVTMKFTEDTLLVMETKTTLGLSRTPGFNATQVVGASKSSDLRKKIALGIQGWTVPKLLEVDPGYMKKLQALEGAMAKRKIAYLHTQVFFDSQGRVNKFVGNGAGIQLNIL